MSTKTMSNLLKHLFLIGSSGYVGFLAGRSCRDENGNFQTKILKEKVDSLLSCYDKIGTVSAATAVTDYKSPSVGLKPNRISEIMKYGYPSMDQVMSFSDFVVSYDRRNRVPHWVFEHLTPETVRGNSDVDRAKCNFTPDPHVHQYFRAENYDYKGSGFDRGHLAAAGNHRKCQKDCDETFYLSNIAPQVGEGFNRDAWNKLERYVRKLVKDHPNVHVCSGPLYLPHKEADGKMYVKYQVIGANNVAVPTHFYKVIVAETVDRKLKMEAYVMPNRKISDDTPLTVFQTSPEVVERSAGLLFFSNLPKTSFYSVNGKQVK